MAGQFRMRACGVVIRDDQIFLIESYEEPLGVHYNLPGGGVEEGEAVREAVRRELREETGYEVEVGNLLLTYEALHEDTAILEEKHHSYGMLFICQLVNGAAPDGVIPTPTLPDGFQTAVKWIPLSRLLTLPLLPDIGSELLAALRGGAAAPAFARHTYTPRKLW